MIEDRSPTSLTADIVAAYVTKNRIDPAELGGVIVEVHRALVGLDAPEVEQPEAAPRLTPAQIRKSITPDALISFIDGRPYKLLKRHLTLHGLDMRAYRERFGLPADYPSTAPAYAARRSELAKSIGLGRVNGRAAEDAAPAAKTSKARAKA